VISPGDLFWAHALANLQVLQVKIAYLPQLVHPLPLSAMQQVNPRSSIVVKEISESASQLLNVFQVYAIQFRSVLR
jgi:hypothetical protein